MADDNNKEKKKDKEKPVIHTESSDRGFIQEINEYKPLETPPSQLDG